MDGTARRWIVVTVLQCFIGGCGLQTPDLQSPLHNPANLHITLDHIVNEVKCELTHGILRAVARDDLLAKENKTAPKLAWLEKWSALATLTLSAEEMAALNPSFSYTEPFSNNIKRFTNGNITTSRSFSLGGGISASADGTRADKVNFFFVFRDFLANPQAPAIDLTVPCEHQSAVLLESHLKLDDWIEQALWPALTNANLTPVGYNQPTSLISHQVTFAVKASANLTPTWRLVPTSINTGSLGLFQANRNETNDLLITLGKTAAADGKQEPAAPSNEVLLSHLAAEIGTSVGASTGSTAR